MDVANQKMPSQAGAAAWGQPMLCKAGSNRPPGPEKPLEGRRADELEGELGSALDDTQPHHCFCLAPPLGNSDGSGTAQTSAARGPGLSIITERVYAMPSGAIEHLKLGGLHFQFKLNSV